MIETVDKLAVSSVSIYEISFLVNKGRLNLPFPLTEWLQEATIESNVLVLPVTLEIATKSGQLPQHHGDPMDRIIVATAMEYQASLLSLDEKFQLYHEIRGKLFTKA